jgi:predicted transcriptional regulator
MLNSDRFLLAFKKIEYCLNKIVKHKKRVKFYDLVQAAIESDPSIRFFQSDLEEYADLRNAIVHRYSNGQVIAEPNDKAVNEIESIASMICNPPRVSSLFKRNVVILSPEDSIEEAVNIMLKKSFSQLPVVKNTRFWGLLTTNTIARWLGSQTSENILNVKQTPITKVLNFTEDRDNHLFLKEDGTLFDVLEYFKEYEKKGKVLNAILITKSGSSSEKLLGIITIWDLPKIYGKLR